MPGVFVGEARFPKNFKRYAREFSLLEIDCEPGSFPGKARLQACAAVAPEGFVFSLAVPSVLAKLEAGVDTDNAWKTAKLAARILKAKWWVVRTPAEVRPTRRTREQLAALFGQLSADGMRVAWEPRGVWDEAAAAETARHMGAHLVQDIAREAPLATGTLYSRLLALGRSARVGLSLADLVAERMQGFEEAFVVVEGQGAREIQKAAKLAVGQDDGLGASDEEELEVDDAEEDGLDEEFADDELDDADSAEDDAAEDES